MALSFNTCTPPLTGEHAGFKYEIYDANSTTATLKLTIPAGETARAIPGCMLATSANIDIKGKIKRTARALLGPDDARYQTFTAEGGSPGWVVIAPSFYGSMCAIPVRAGETLCVGDNAFVASCGDIETSKQRQSLKKAFYSGHGMFVREVSGSGLVFVAAVGSLVRTDLAGGEQVTVDNGHLVSWPKNMDFDIQKASKTWSSSGLSGEGVVCKFTGPGSINLQTRNARDIVEWVYRTKPPAVS